MCVPKNAAQRLILVTIRIMKFSPQITESLLCSLNTEILIVSTDFFDALIKDNKIHDEIDKTLFIEHRINLLQEFVVYGLALLTDTDIHRITFFLMFLEAIILPFHVELLAGQKSAITQPLGLISGHTELHSRKEALNECIFLICQILTDAF